jgi:hypothetical protein
MYRSIPLASSRGQENVAKFFGPDVRPRAEVSNDTAADIETQRIDDLLPLTNYLLSTLMKPIFLSAGV